MFGVVFDLTWAAAAIGMAWLTAGVLIRRFGAPAPMGRYHSLDGLRGMLAVSVMIHHAAVWYGFATTGNWLLPASTVYAELGQGSVLMFFMITSFLFVSKLIHAKDGVDWLHMLVSRIMRLTPLYWFAMLCMFCMVGMQTRWQLHEPAALLLDQAEVWLGYTVSGFPDINHLANTGHLVADVTWTLVYEWMFYLALPLLAWLMGRKPGWLPLLFSMLVLWWMFDRWHPNLRMVVVFVMGGLTAVLVSRADWFKSWTVTQTASWLVLAGILAVLVLFHSAYDAWPTLILWTCFTLIAGGNSLFGWLVHPATRQLGDQAYSIYLLHGMTLYAMFHGAIGEKLMQSWTFSTYWLVLLGIVPIVTMLCYATWRWVEQGGMRLAKRVLAAG